MTANIVQRVHAFLGVTDNDFSPVQSDRTHLALGNIGEGKGFLELRIAHVRVSMKSVRAL